MVPMLERLEQGEYIVIATLQFSDVSSVLTSDFPDAPLDSAFAQAMFIKAGTPGSRRNCNATSQLMRDRSVTRHDVWQVCLQDLRSLDPLMYAIKELEGFDATEFITELVDVIVDQPYRGWMLR